MCMLNMFTYFGSDGFASVAPMPRCPDAPWSPLFARRINSEQICRYVSVFFSAAPEWYIGVKDK